MSARLRQSMLILCLLAVGLTGLFCTQICAAEGQGLNPRAAAGKPLELFGAMEFRGSLKALKSWQALVEKARQQVADFSRCATSASGCNAAARSWQLLQVTAKPVAQPEQLKLVNQFFNRWPYRLDLETYNQSDYWATPKEFMQLSGDCEDYSISKYFALRQLGYPAENLRIVIVKDSIRNVGHAVLAIYQTDQVYILDNLSDLILPQDLYSHYQPQYSVNEEYRWAHIRKFTGLAAKPSKMKGPENAK